MGKEIKPKAPFNLAGKMNSLPGVDSYPTNTIHHQKSQTQNLN
jgi:hypothetical protein